MSPNMGVPTCRKHPNNNAFVDSTWEVLTNFQRQYDYYKSEFDASGSEGKFKQHLAELHRKQVLFSGNLEDSESEYLSGARSPCSIGWSWILRQGNQYMSSVCISQNLGMK